jgi:hypothetical protein
MMRTLIMSISCADLFTVCQVPLELGITLELLALSLVRALSLLVLLVFIAHTPTFYQSLFARKSP